MISSIYFEYTAGNYSRAVMLMKSFFRRYCEENIPYYKDRQEAWIPENRKISLNSDECEYIKKLINNLGHTLLVPERVFSQQDITQRDINDTITIISSSLSGHTFSATRIHNDIINVFHNLAAWVINQISIAIASVDIAHLTPFANVLLPDTISHILSLSEQYELDKNGVDTSRLIHLKLLG